MRKSGNRRKQRPPVEASFVSSGLYHFTRENAKTSNHPLLAVLKRAASKLTRKDLKALTAAFDGINEDGSSLIK